MKKSPQWTYRQAVFFLVSTTLTTLVLSVGSYTLWRKGRNARLANPEYRVVAIVQTGPEKEALKTSYLAELLSLSSDRPISLYSFDIKEGEKKLAACPLISAAKIKRVDPGTLYIDYTVRKAVARLADYENIGVDQEGHLFPLVPFFPPRNLPEIYLGLPPFGSSADEQGREGGSWQAPLQNRHLSLALEILGALGKVPWQEGMRIKKIDVSNAFAQSAGQREVVLFTEDEIAIGEGGGLTVCLFPKILRLPTKDYFRQLSNFFSLRDSMMEDYRRQIGQTRFSQPVVAFTPRIIDLRLSQMAFVENHS